MFAERWRWAEQDDEFGYLAHELNRTLDRLRAAGGAGGQLVSVLLSSEELSALARLAEFAGRSRARGASVLRQPAGQDSQ